MVWVFSFLYLKYFYPYPTLNKHYINIFYPTEFCRKSGFMWQKTLRYCGCWSKWISLQQQWTEGGGIVFQRISLSDVIHIVEICFKYLNNEYKSCIVSRYRVMYSSAGALCYCDLMIYVLDSQIEATCIGKSFLPAALFVEARGGGGGEYPRWGSDAAVSVV